VILSFVFIPLWGAVGAALATAISIVCWNVLLVGLAYKRLGINTTAFARLS